MTMEASTDCRTEIGITVGLVDSLIYIARILVKRNLSSYEVTQALVDLISDEDVNGILDLARSICDEIRA